MSDGHFEVLEADECRQLLTEATVGRLAFDGPDGLTILPLSYTVDGELLIIRTADGTQLSQLDDEAPVAFEVDDFDQQTTNGWSVLVRGRLVHVSEDQLSMDFTTPTPFVPGLREVVRGVSLDRVGGRAVANG
ncbi:pyridoxamine 5'-phosphate oxidase family protein [Luteococcus sp. Sow4_B9]|uniref:pyridoxamine 5'-phosphate oxidase family protein n=1 Tax=Luteococcus sp. Sow4_B9 TaxID=3438792 RepID=UPI003F9D9468